MRRLLPMLLAAAASLGVLVPLTTAQAGSRSGGVIAGSPIVAVLDSGVRTTHQAFDYRGPASTKDQVVAWWDFTPTKKGKIVAPRRGQIWDPRVLDPYDDVGHGTGVASMAVGLRRTGQTPSAAPGYRLAVAKFDGPGGTGSLADAIRWAVHTVHASVINLSYGSITPVPAAIYADALDAMDDAWRSGVLVVVGNGNGWANVGSLPGEPGWATGFSMSTSVLAVGGADLQGVLQTSDPEVTAVESVNAADYSGDHGYTLEGGTSFASPFVAGFAARVVAAARSAHRSVSPDRLRRLIEYVAVDGTRPPVSEGYGSVSLAELPNALEHARAGTLPKRPNPDDSAWYVENVGMKMRDLWSNQLRSP